MIELFFLIFVPSFTQELEVCFYVVQVRTSDVAKTHEIQQKYNGHLKKNNCKAFTQDIFGFYDISSNILQL